MSDNTAHKQKAAVAIIMGSDSDWPVMKAAAQMLADLGVAYEARVVSAHRTPDLMFEFAATAEAKGVPVATFAIGEAGAANAGIFAASILAVTDTTLAAKLQAFRAKQTDKVLAMQLADQP